MKFGNASHATSWIWSKNSRNLSDLICLFSVSSFFLWFCAIWRFSCFFGRRRGNRGRGRRLTIDGLRLTSIKEEEKERRRRTKKEKEMCLCCFGIEHELKKWLKAIWRLKRKSRRRKKEVYGLEIKKRRVSNDKTTRTNALFKKKKKRIKCLKHFS